MDDVSCLDPTRGGINFANGSWGGATSTTRGVLTDLVVTLANDDALAMNSCYGDPASDCGYTGGFQINGNWTGDNSSTSRFSSDVNATAGSAFFGRSAKDITTTEVFFNRAHAENLNGDPVGDTQGAIQLEDGSSTTGDFGNNQNLIFRDGEIDGGSLVNGVYFDHVTGQSGIAINNNRIDYSLTTNNGGPFCGIKITAGTTSGGISWTGNNFQQTTRKICDSR
jgi:hypothetical protein